MLPLTCRAQNYEWGRPAASSEVAQLAQANGSTLDEQKPYAELWMGTHPNCPAVVAATGTTLSSWIEAHPACLGTKVQQRFGTNIPYLFKVLSVNKALSIQSHPDKALAEKLHAQQPKMYPDDNHKPEMALAISDDFEALCAFAPLPQISDALHMVPELASLVGKEHVEAVARAAHSSGYSKPATEEGKQALKGAFTALMTAPQEAVTAAVTGLVARLKAAHGAHTDGNDKGHCVVSAEGERVAQAEALALRLDAQYPGGDVGVMAAFFLNILKLKTGQAIYLPANEPHAYLQGELVECMAASDNVIRAGLTPKFKHADVLCTSLTYETGLPEVLHGDVTPLPSSSGSASVSLYRPPFEEFEVRAVRLGAGAQGVSLPVDEGPLLLLVQRGQGRCHAEGGGVGQGAGLQAEVELKRGSIHFVPADTQLTLASSEAEEMLIWVAATNATFFLLWKAIGQAAEAPAHAAAAAH